MKNKVAPVIIAAVLLFPGAFADCEVHAASAEGMRAEIAAAIPSAGDLLDPSAVAHGALQALQGVYSSSGNAPLWLRDGRVTRQAEALLLELQNAESYGLETKDYPGSELATLLNVQSSSDAADNARWARFDVRLSAAVMRFISDLHYGRVTPESAGFKLGE